MFWYCVPAGGTVHMVCRSQQRGEQALKEIKAAAANEVLRGTNQYLIHGQGEFGTMLPKH